MSAEDRERWEARYAAGSHAGEEADPFVIEALLHAPRGGRALDVACGAGRHAIALARRGYAVDALDVSPAAIAMARSRAGGLAVRWAERDLDDAAIEEGVYAAVVCVHYTDERLVPRLVGALAPGGLLVFVARPRALCRFGPPPGATARWFASLEPLLVREGESRVLFAGRRP
ncbi:MAG: class I SAM-dependent methyltransferase [Planctomycetaceae bacterium]